MIRKSENPKILDDIKGSIARASLLQGEPIRREKLIKGDGGLMSAILPSGKRAVAINIDSQGSTTAGGFILPNDRVDVIQTYPRRHQGPRAPTVSSARPCCSNVRCGPSARTSRKRTGRPWWSARTRRSNSIPCRPRRVVLAQRTGQLSLTLRSMLGRPNQAAARRPPSPRPRKGMTVVRFGTQTEDANR